jgi:O-acetylserine/cysteine efflux transporter
VKFSDLFIAIAITAIWGLNFSVIKLGLATLDPFILAGLRFFLCAIPLIFFIKKPDVPIKIVAGYGIIFGAGLWGMVNLGVYLGASAGVASLVLQFSAFMTIFMGYIFLKETLTKQKLLGIILSMVGLILIMTVTDGSVSLIGIFMVLLGALSWSITNIIIKKSGTKNVFSFLVWGCLFASPPLFVIGYFTGGSQAYIHLIDSLNQVAIFSILFQAYPTTLIGYWVWNSLLRKYPISNVAPISLLVPIFGFLGSVWIFNEVITSIKVIASVFILLGLIISLYGDKIKLIYNK